MLSKLPCSVAIGVVGRDLVHEAERGTGDKNVSKAAQEEGENEVWWLAFYFILQSPRLNYKVDV